jgi:CheY-like chemotaxis protein
MPFKILVVDDHIYDRTDTIFGLPALLEQQGYEVLTTADGENAYDLVFEYKPDLIVLDIHFGHQDIDGVEICQAITIGYYDTDKTPKTPQRKSVDEVTTWFIKNEAGETKDED